jgi:hypothetical protein
VGGRRRITALIKVQVDGDGIDDEPQNIAALRQLHHSFLHVYVLHFKSRLAKVNIAMLLHLSE